MSGKSSDGISTRTLGCRLNSLESSVMADNARLAGIGRAVIVNTCAVTAQAVRQSRQEVRRARRSCPDGRVIVTGCAAHLDPEGFSAMPEVDAVIGNDIKTEPDAFFRSSGVLPSVRHGFVRRSAVQLHHDGRARAYVQIQSGCDHSCTFCIIPRGRGAAVSVSADRIIDQIRVLVGIGYREIMLTGVDIASWGLDICDGRSGLGGLIDQVLCAVDGDFRLRLSSLDPHCVDEAVVAAFADHRRLAPSVHLSIQSGDDMILKRMRRRHRRSDVVAICARLRQARPEIALGADLIAGFPTETDDMFAATESLVEVCGLDYLHVFAFSARVGTPAARMPQLSGAVISDRAARLRLTGSRRLGKWLDRHVGCTERVIVGTGRDVRLADYAPARLAAGVDGPTVVVRLSGHDGSALVADPV